MLHRRKKDCLTEKQAGSGDVAQLLSACLSRMKLWVQSRHHINCGVTGKRMPAIPALKQQSKRIRSSKSSLVKGDPDSKTNIKKWQKLLISSEDYSWHPIKYNFCWCGALHCQEHLEGKVTTREQLPEPASQVAKLVHLLKYKHGCLCKWCVHGKTECIHQKYPQLSREKGS